LQQYFWVPLLIISPASGKFGFAVMHAILASIGCGSQFAGGGGLGPPLILLVKRRYRMARARAMATAFLRLNFITSTKYFIFTNTG